MKEYEKTMRVITYCIVGIVLAFLVSLLTGCTTTKYVEVEKVKTDTVYKSKIERDSVWLHDSVFVKEYTKGDTVFRDRDRWHTKFVEKLITDTVYKSRVDSIPVPYPVEKLVPRELSWYQNVLMWSGGIAIVAIIIFILIKFQFFGLWRWIKSML